MSDYADGTEITTEEFDEIQASKWDLLWNWFNAPILEFEATQQAMIELIFEMEEAAKEAFEDERIDERTFLEVENYHRRAMEDALLFPRNGKEFVIIASTELAAATLLRGAAKVIGRRETPTAMARRLGKAGEDIVGLFNDIGKRTKITINGRTRFPDGVNLPKKTVSEVKNVKNQAFTAQLRDYLDFANSINPPLEFRLFVRPTTVLSGPLQNKVDSGEIILCIIQSGVSC